MTTEPQAWIGCLAAYNAGHLHGRWVDLLDEDDLADDCKKILASSPVDDAEELWVMDHEGLPISGECSPAEALRLGLIVHAFEDKGFGLEIVTFAMDQIRSDGLAELLEYVENNYAGHYEDAESLAYGVCENMGWEAPAWAIHFIDYKAMGESLLVNDYNHVELNSGGIAVFYSQ